MKNAIALLIMTVLASSTSFADSHTNGYVRRDGTYVQGYTRSAPDAYRYNNYGSETRGGYRRDEYSTDSATNRSNTSGYGWRDNDRDGVPNAYDRRPESRRGW